jgi:hypothetical protein
MFISILLFEVSTNNSRTTTSNTKRAGPWAVEGYGSPGCEGALLWGYDGTGGTIDTGCIQVSEAASVVVSGYWVAQLCSDAGCNTGATVELVSSDGDNFCYNAPDGILSLYADVYVPG